MELINEKWKSRLGRARNDAERAIVLRDIYDRVTVHRWIRLGASLDKLPSRCRRWASP